MFNPTNPELDGDHDVRYIALHHAMNAEDLLQQLNEPAGGAARLTAMSAQVLALRAQAHADLAAFWLGAATDDDARRVTRDGTEAAPPDTPLFSEAIDLLSGD